MREIKLVRRLDTGILATSQSFTVPNLGGDRLRFRFYYAPIIGRWFFDLTVGAEQKISGRKVVLNSNMFAPCALGIGAFVAFNVEGKDEEPNRDNITSGAVRLYHITPEEQANLVFGQHVSPAE